MSLLFNMMSRLVIAPYLKLYSWPLCVFPFLFWALELVPFSDKITVTSLYIKSLLPPAPPQPHSRRQASENHKQASLWTFHYFVPPACQHIFFTSFRLAWGLWLAQKQPVPTCQFLYVMGHYVPSTWLDLSCFPEAWPGPALHVAMNTVCLGHFTM